MCEARYKGRRRMRRFEMPVAEMSQSLIDGHCLLAESFEAVD